jgi:DNA alkylation damage repair protein AlkB
MNKQPSTASMNPTEEANFSAFKKREKQYKYFVDRKTDFSGMIDLNNSKLDPALNIEEFVVIHPKTQKSVRGYRFPKPSGLIVLKEYTEIERQLFICRKALNEYHRKPHRTNLFIYDKEAPDQTPEKNACSDGKPKAESCMAPQEHEEAPGEPCNSTIILMPPALSDSEKVCKGGAGPRQYNKEHYILQEGSRYFFNTKIRWSNIGRQYNWDKRDYHAKHTPMPPELSDIAREIVGLLKMGEYRPEALIVNYYGSRNFMGGHLDDGEPDQLHPIVSFSFGLSCVFLIGGNTKDVDPIALKLDSGDVMIMSNQSRNCYHGRYLQTHIRCPQSS